MDSLKTECVPLDHPNGPAANFSMIIISLADATSAGRLFNAWGARIREQDLTYYSETLDSLQKR